MSWQVDTLSICHTQSGSCGMCLGRHKLCLSFFVCRNDSKEGCIVGFKSIFLLRQCYCDAEQSGLALHWVSSLWLVTCDVLWNAVWPCCGADAVIF